MDTIPFKFLSETFAETLPQYFVLTILINSSIIDDGNYAAGTAISIYNVKRPLSMLSSSFGMAKFLQLGPCQLIPQNKMGIGMFLITEASLWGLYWKVGAITSALTIYMKTKNPSSGPTPWFFESFWISICIILLPSIILVTLNTFNYIKSYG